MKLGSKRRKLQIRGRLEQWKREGIEVAMNEEAESGTYTQMIKEGSWKSHLLRKWWYIGISGEKGRGQNNEGRKSFGEGRQRERETETVSHVIARVPSCRYFPCWRTPDTWHNERVSWEIELFPRDLLQQTRWGSSSILPFFSSCLFIVLSSRSSLWKEYSWLSYMFKIWWDRLIN